jgi:hypothetical protein
MVIDRDRVAQAVGEIIAAIGEYAEPHRRHVC